MPLQVSQAIRFFKRSSSRKRNGMPAARISTVLLANSDKPCISSPSLGARLCSEPRPKGRNKSKPTPDTLPNHRARSGSCPRYRAFRLVTTVVRLHRIPNCPKLRIPSTVRSQAGVPSGKWRKALASPIPSRLMPTAHFIEASFRQ